MRYRCRLLAATSLLLLAAHAYAQSIPAHPRELRFPGLGFVPPAWQEARSEIAPGVAAFVATERELPLVTIALHFAVGGFDDPAGREGLAELALELVRTGGAGERDCAEVLRTLDALAILSETSVRDTTCRIAVSCLREDLPSAVELLRDMVRAPRLDPDRFELLRAQRLEDLRHRFDAPDDIARTVLRQVLYGDHPAGRLETGASLEAIGLDDVRAFVAERLQPGALVVSVGGDLDGEEARVALAPLFAGWEARPPLRRDPLPALEPAKPGVTVIDMPTDGAILLAGHLCLDRRDPDYERDEPGVRLANVILGGSFTSRLVRRVRTQEGLAYSTWSDNDDETGYPGLESLYAGVPATGAAWTARLLAEETERLATDGPTDDEVAAAKRSQFAYWVDFFSDPASVADRWAELLLEGRPLDWHATWLARAEAVDRDAVASAARRWIRARDLHWVAVGPIETLLAEDEVHGAALANLGPVRVLELPDPLARPVIPDR